MSCVCGSHMPWSCPSEWESMSTGSLSRPSSRYQTACSPIVSSGMNRLFLPGIEEPSAELLGRAEIRLGLSEGRLTIALERGTHGLVRQQRLDEIGAPVLDRLHGRS